VPQLERLLLLLLVVMLFLATAKDVFGIMGFWSPSTGWTTVSEKDVGTAVPMLGFRTAALQQPSGAVSGTPLIRDVMSEAEPGVANADSDNPNEPT
jgi:hypothetical protein